jgi:hypothetical protein
MREAKPSVQTSHLDILIKTMPVRGECDAAARLRDGRKNRGVTPMALDRTFVALTPERLAAMIMDARRRAVYAAPSLSLDVAAALINARDRLGAEAVAVVVDISEGTLRLGYGVVDALGMLRENKLPVRHAEGLRISFIAVDDEGFVFALPPLLVEDTSHGDDHPNAVRASGGQIEQLVAAILPPDLTTTVPAKDGETVVGIQHAEIGRVIAPPRQIEKVKEAIKANPVENFDLTRIVNVFSTHFQFYELVIVGSRVENRTVQLPKELLASIRDKATRDRIRAAFKMLSKQSRISGEAIHKKATEIRKRFIRHHPIYGGVILKTTRAALDAEITTLEKLIEKHRKAVLASFDQDGRKSIADLVKEAMEARSRRTGITADRVVTELAKLAFANLGDYMPEELGAHPYKHLQGLDRDRRAVLEEVQVEHFVERRGEDARQVRKVKFKLHDKQSALDSLARHLGMYAMSERRGRSAKVVRSIADPAGASSWPYWLA